MQTKREMMLPPLEEPSRQRLENFKDCQKREKDRRGDSDKLSLLMISDRRKCYREV